MPRVTVTRKTHKRLVVIGQCPTKDGLRIYDDDTDETLAEFPAVPGCSCLRRMPDAHRWCTDQGWDYIIDHDLRSLQRISHHLKRDGV